MSKNMPTRDETLALLKEFNRTDRAVKHALAVEAVMRHMARKCGEDEELWGIVGLIHDLDYEQFPNEHCIRTGEILRQRGWPEEITRAAVSHGWGICCDVEPQSRMDKTLFAVDELTGLVAASALVRPSKSILDLTPRSVQKKWKSKGFAASVNREVIDRGAAMLGVERSELIRDVIEGMQAIAAELGLAGPADGEEAKGAP